MRDGGFDEVGIDAVGNVVGRYRRHGGRPHPVDRQPLRHGAQRRQVRRPPGHLRAHGLRARAEPPGRRLPFQIEVVAFAEEEGQRYPATFLGSGALTGDFQPAWLDQVDADSISMREALRRAGLRAEDISRLRRDPARYLGFIEVHIEQARCCTSWACRWPP